MLTYKKIISFNDEITPNIFTMENNVINIMIFK